MFVKTYNQTGKEIGKTLLPKEIFEVEMKEDLVHQVAVSQMANKRQISAHTKNRGEVSGGGKKPWQQKGTGRARHGSIRSPIWRHGGVTFGPRKDKVYKKVIPQKMRRKALFMVLSAKAKDNFVLVLDKISFEKPKTKLMKNVLDNLPIKGSCLIALPKLEKDIILSARNLPKAETIEVRNLSVLDLLSFKYLILPKESIAVIKETFLRKEQ